MIRTLTYFLFISTFISCTQSLKAEMTSLCSSPILLHKELNYKYNGKDTTINNQFNNKIKLIVYINSSGCSSCSINKMHLWKPYIEYANISENKFMLYFIFSPSQKGKRELLVALNNNPFDYPVIIDENGDFEKLNPHLPKNKALHTFLLDENNKVILVGNPLYNKEIEKLFYEKTQELLAK